MSATPDAHTPFSVNVETSDDGTCLLCSGELDIGTADALKRALDEVDFAAGSRVTIDLSGVGFMDSTGLRLLIAAHRSAQEGGSELAVVTGESPARRVLELTRMDEHINVVTRLD
ncbi:MAG: STAS domain-containing protein [Actinobacteria bacterium]|nr:STAS domain-containing protein [Actinomycetota bacterium]